MKVCVLSQKLRQLVLTGREKLSEYDVNVKVKVRVFQIQLSENKRLSQLLPANGPAYSIWLKMKPFSYILKVL